MTKCHALDAQGHVIEGLYAAGECTGGIHGGGQSSGGNAVASTVIFGQIAGRNAATGAQDHEDGAASLLIQPHPWDGMYFGDA